MRRRVTRDPRTPPPWVVVAATFATACAGIERSADWPESAPPPPGAFAAPGPFSEMRADAIWGVGDRVVYSVDVDDGGVHHAFTFTLTTTRLPPVDPDGIVIAHPVHGRVVTRSARDQWQHNPIAYSGDGMATLQAELAGDDGTACGGSIEAELLAYWWVDDMGVGMTVGVHPVFAALLGLDCMHSTLLRLIRAPSAWSVIRNLGHVRVGLEWLPVDKLHYVEQETPFGVMPTAWLPMTITANGQPALDGRVQFTWKRSPLLLSAGVLQIEAWHPDDATRRVTVRLASACRGEPPDAPAATDLGNGLSVGMTVSEVLALKGGVLGAVKARGRLADGRCVELVEFEVLHQWLFGVLHEGRLLFASLGPHLSRDFLRRRGFVPDADSPPLDGDSDR